MQPHQFLNQCKTYTGAFVGSTTHAFYAVEAFENLGLLLFGNAQAGIFHPQFNLLGDGFQTYRDSSDECELKRV